MNSLKTVFVVMLLAGAMYGVYVTINSHGEEQDPPPGASSDWAGPPAIEMPGAGGSTPSFSSASGAAGSWSQDANRLAGSPGLEGASEPALPGHVEPPRPGAGMAPRYSPNSGTPSHDASAESVGRGPANPYSSAGSYGQGEGLSAAVAPRYGANAEDNGGSAAASGLSLRSDRPTGDASDTPDLPVHRTQGPGGPTSETSAFLRMIQQKLAEGQLSEVHLALSSWRDDPRLSAEEAAQVDMLLDQLAGTVIYSREHLLEPAYRVRSGDTLERIGEQYSVPGGLLAKINGVQDPLQPGQELKVVRGPFSAVVDLERYQLTLMLNGRYAGRFAIGVGGDQPQLEGTYEVQNKTVNPTYYGPNQIVDADNPQNPLGERWIGLGDRLGLHGTHDPELIGQTGGPGFIRLGQRDIDDLYDILTMGSRVVIRR